MTGTPVVIDARDLLCPLPVLRLRKVLAALPAGALCRLIATDRMAMVDVPHFCEAGGHAMVRLDDPGDGTLDFTIRKGSPAPADGGGPAPSGDAD